MSTATVRNGTTINVYSDVDPLTNATYWAVMVIDADGNLVRLGAQDEAHAHRISKAYQRAAHPGRTLPAIRAAARTELKAQS